MKMDLASLSVKVFADGANLDDMVKTYQTQPLVKGFTTNPTLMRKAGISDYEGFARQVLAAIADRPISFEVFSDEFEEMERQALRIASWGDNVYVKIPVTNTRGDPLPAWFGASALAGVKQNAHGTDDPGAGPHRNPGLGRRSLFLYFSVCGAHRRQRARSVAHHASFAGHNGRGTATGADLGQPAQEVLNVVQANQIGCHIITVTNDLIAKTASFGKDLLTQFSL